MRPHKEAHGNDLHNHFASVNLEEDEVNILSIPGDSIYFLIQSQKHAVHHNHQQDKTVEPRVDCYDLDDFVSEGIRDGKAAQRNCGVVLGEIVLLAVVCIWVRRQSLLQCSWILNAELAQRESGDLNC